MADSTPAPAPDRIVFLEATAGLQFAIEHGLAAEPALADVQGSDGRVWAGYVVPADRVEAVRTQATDAGLAFEPAPEPSALVPRTLPALRDIDGAALAAATGWSPREARLVGRAVGKFLDTAGTAMGRATFYGSRAEQEAAELRAHDALMAMHRLLYGALAALPGTTDRTRATAVQRLLSTPDTTGVDLDQEWAILDHLVAELTPPRKLRLFGALRKARVNNARTRRLILRHCLDHGRVELWAIRYRRKMQAALQHAWGNRALGIVRSILAKPAETRTDQERRILRDRIHKYSSQPAALLEECCAFILGAERDWTLPLLRAHRDAKTDLTKGAPLPPEVLEGIRSTFHPERPVAEVLELAKRQFTTGQRLAVQATAEKAGVEVAFDPAKYDAVRLYLYALERGLTPAIEAALDSRAAERARTLPAKYGHVGILLDASASMAGSATQPLRPIATALAVRDALAAASQQATVQVSGGIIDGRLILPEGDTDLAGDLVALAREGVDAIYILSDGYENAPAGRVAETIAVLRSLRIGTPIIQLNPVHAADAGGVRALAATRVPALPVHRPEALGLSLVRGLLDAEPLGALALILRQAAPRLGPGGAA